MNNTILVNGSHPLPDDYMAKDLISLYSVAGRSFFLPPVEMQLNSAAAEALNDMCLAAKEEGSFDCIITGAYRTRVVQEELYKADQSDSFAAPGCSEHETGLAVDIISTDAERTSKLHRYLRENAHRFGFIYRYPRGREMITHMAECPEHYRFVGTEAAGIIKERGLTLEEYHDSSIVRPDPYDLGFIFMSIFGPKMKGHWQKWPDIDLEELRKINPDTVGWIYMENTPINYPIMFHEDHPGYYLNHNFSNEPSAQGGIELTARPKDGIFVLSGHHMKDCSMFMKLIEISDRESFDVHPNISIMYEGTIYDATWFAALNLSYADDIPMPENTDLKTRMQWLKSLKEKSFVSNQIIPKETDKILVCSTCMRGNVGLQVLYGVMKER